MNLLQAKRHILSMISAANDKGENGMNMKNQRIVIIGGSSGIGLETAKLFVEGGAQVIIGSRSKQKLSEAKMELGEKVKAYAVDMTDEESVKAFFDQIGPFDHLVLTAAQGAGGMFLDLPVPAAQSAFESKFWGQYRAAKYGAAFIREGGTITFFSGALSQKPLPGRSTQSAINSAVESLARALAIELSPVRVNTISPGTVDTPAYGHMDEKERQDYYEQIASRLPAKNIGRPRDIAEAVKFVVTNRFMTGSTIEINGGHPLV